MVATRGMLVELLDLEQIEATSSEAAAPTRTCSMSSAARWPARRSSPLGAHCAAGSSWHSLHAYFIRPGDPDVPIVYTVDRIRDGRSFTTRRVVAVQHGRAIFALSASFQVAETGPEYQSLMARIGGHGPGDDEGHRGPGGQASVATSSMDRPRLRA